MTLAPVFRSRGVIRSVLFTVSSLGLAVPAAAQSMPEFPLATDVASPEAIVAAAYASIQRAPGEDYQWDRFSSLFLPGAQMIPNTEQTGGRKQVLSVDEFVSRIRNGTTIGGDNDRGFAEEAISSKIERFGDVAHVFSTYQKHFWQDEQILGRGINSFQLVHIDGRWWITGIVWDEESGAGPLPEKYLR
ncbi:MAG: hypothetical protein ABFS14_12995 [Gemmatimonadota bacterium]